MDPRQRLHMMDLLRSMAAAGRTILFSSHILEEVERLADSVLVIYAGRLAASGDFRSIRRLMTDRPHTFTVRSSDDRRLAAALLARPVGLRGRAGRRACCRSGPPTTGRSRRPCRGSRGREASRCSRCARPTTRSRASSATWCADDRRRCRSSAVTLRGLLGRRRTLLMLLLVAPAGPDRAAGPASRAAASRSTGSSTRWSCGPSCRSSRSSSGPRPSARRSRTGRRST